MNRGTICYTTVLGGLGHDQGTRPVLVIGRNELGERTGETIVLPISYVEPAWPYPLSWPVPGDCFRTDRGYSWAAHKPRWSPSCATR